MHANSEIDDHKRSFVIFGLVLHRRSNSKCQTEMHCLAGFANSVDHMVIRVRRFSCFPAMGAEENHLQKTASLLNPAILYHIPHLNTIPEITENTDSQKYNNTSDQSQPAEFSNCTTQQSIRQQGMAPHQRQKGLFLSSIPLSLRFMKTLLRHYR